MIWPQIWARSLGLGLKLWLQTPAKLFKHATRVIQYMLWYPTCRPKPRDAKSSHIITHMLLIVAM